MNRPSLETHSIMAHTHMIPRPQDLEAGPVHSSTSFTSVTKSICALSSSTASNGDNSFPETGDIHVTFIGDWLEVTVHGCTARKAIRCLSAGHMGSWTHADRSLACSSLPSPPLLKRTRLQRGSSVLACRWGRSRTPGSACQLQGIQCRLATDLIDPTNNIRTARGCNHHLLDFQNPDSPGRLSVPISLIITPVAAAGVDSSGDQACAIPAQRLPLARFPSRALAKTCLISGIYTNESDHSYCVATHNAKT